MQTIDITEKDGSVTQYARDHNGVIKQLYPKKFVYDESYIDVYNSPDYQYRAKALQRLRLGFIQAVWPYANPITSLIDIGFGTGAFLKHVRDSGDIADLYGFDIIEGMRCPKEVQRADHAWDQLAVDVMTFWDVLEHFPDLSFLRYVQSKMIVISCPWSILNGSLPLEKFTNWHHRKPNEHLHHFDKESLMKTMKMYGWKSVSAGSNMEDLVRRPKTGHPPGYPNILTAAFIKP